MFQRLIMAIFRLYMKYLLSSYTKHTLFVKVNISIAFVYLTVHISGWSLNCHLRQSESMKA